MSGITISEEVINEALNQGIRAMLIEGSYKAYDVKKLIENTFTSELSRKDSAFRSLASDSLRTIVRDKEFLNEVDSALKDAIKNSIQAYAKDALRGQIKAAMKHAVDIHGAEIRAKVANNFEAVVDEFLKGDSD